MDMDTSKDRLVVKIRLRRRDDPALGLIDSMAVTTIRHLSERKLASRDCTLRRAVLIQKALPFLETSASSSPLSPPSPSAYVAAEEHPWDRDPPCFDGPVSSSPTTCMSDGGIMLPTLEDDLDHAAFGGADAPLLFHSSEERDRDWFDQECGTDYAEPMLTSASSLSASLEDDDAQGTAPGVVSASEQPEISLASCADSDEEEEEEAVRELFRKFSSTPSSRGSSPACARKQGASALGKRSRYLEDAEDASLGVTSEEEEDDELAQYSAAAQAEPLKCSKPSRTASPCGMTRRASTTASPCSSFPVLSLV